MSTTTRPTLLNLTPSKQIPRKYPDLFPEKKWKWKVAQREHNGLARAFSKIGKDLYVNEIILAECIAEQAGS